MRKSDILAEIAALEKKYFDLVWLARKRPEDRPIAADAIDRVLSAYPDEAARLGGENADWEHGFNSGCLAALRFAMGLMGSSDDAQMARDDFPFLDT